MAEKRTGKQGSRDNGELSRAAARYLAGEISREQVCRSVDGQQTTRPSDAIPPRGAAPVKT
jgi:hypothetical protein